MAGSIHSCTLPIEDNVLIASAPLSPDHKVDTKGSYTPLGRTKPLFTVPPIQIGGQEP